MLIPGTRVGQVAEPLDHPGTAARFCLMPALALAGLLCLALILGYRQMTVAVPDVAAARLEEALSILKAKQLVPVPHGQEFTALPDLPVAGTAPPAGTRVWRGSPVSIELAQSPTAFVVPNLLGLSRAAAVERLRGGLFNLGAERSIYTDQPPGIVAQNPRPDDVTRGGLIDVLFSLGPEPARLVTPRLVGVALDLILDVYGRRLQRIEEIRYRPVRPDESSGDIVEQDPVPGDPLDADGIRLVVAAAPELPRFRILHYPLPSDASGSEVSVLLGDELVYRGQAAPGTTLRVPIPAPSEPASVQIWMDETLLEELTLANSRR